MTLFGQETGVTAQFLTKLTFGKKRSSTHLKIKVHQTKVFNSAGVTDVAGTL
jgi:glutamine synthetase